MTGPNQSKNCLNVAVDCGVLLSVNSLVNSMTKGDLVSSGSYGERITDGIDITTWIANNHAGTEKITFSVWDFAGQTVYYNTHQVRVQL
jgi:GTPase SAR1 family protein